MINIKRIRAIKKYFIGADPIYGWRIRKSVCPNCNSNYFFQFKNTPFMTRCVGCLANLTNLSIIRVVERHKINHEVHDAWEMSSYGATLSFLNRNIKNVIASEYFPGTKSGESLNGTLCQDVQCTSFESGSLDLITSNQVFEHVPDDIHGYKECFRVLRGGGALILTVPLYPIKETEQKAKITNSVDVVHLCEPEYHDSRAGGANSALVFWRHSVNDIVSRVNLAGFNSQLIKVEILPDQDDPQLVVYARKITR